MTDQMKSQGIPGSKLLIRLNILILAIFGFFYISKLLDMLPKDISNGINVWVYTDWLIDYSSGFVRRGLSGELVDLLSGYSHPRFIIGVLTWLIFSAVVIGYLRLLSRSLKTLPPLLFFGILFLPNLLPFYLYDHGAFGRKEIIGFLFLLYHLYSLERSIMAPELPDYNIYLKRVFPLSLVFLPLHILIHESSFLLFVPIHVIISYSVMRSIPLKTLKRTLLELAFLYLPALITLGIVFFFGRPSFEVAQSICNKWELVNALEAGSCSFTGRNPTWALPGTISSLPWSISQAASLSLALSGKSIIAWIINFLILGLATVYVGRMVIRLINQDNSKQVSEGNQTRSQSRGIFYKYFLLPLFLSAPLYVLGWDVGRWFAVTCINYIMVTLSKEMNYLENRLKTNTEVGTMILQVVVILVGGSMILMGAISDMIGLGSGDFGLTQVLAIIIGIGLLLTGLFGRRVKEYINQNPFFETSGSLYLINSFFLIMIIFFLRLPHCCQHDGFKMLAEPVKSFAEKILYLP
jgi:hypothetical protein